RRRRACPSAGLDGGARLTSHRTTVNLYIAIERYNYYNALKRSPSWRTATDSRRRTGHLRQEDSRTQRLAGDLQQPLRERLFIDRLAEEIAGAGLTALHLVDRLLACRDDDD